MQISKEKVKQESQTNIPPREKYGNVSKDRCQSSPISKLQTLRHLGYTILQRKNAHRTKEREMRNRKHRDRYHAAQRVAENSSCQRNPCPVSRGVGGWLDGTSTHIRRLTMREDNYQRNHQLEESDHSVLAEAQTRAVVGEISRVTGEFRSRTSLQMQGVNFPGGRVCRETRADHSQGLSQTPLPRG